METGRRASIGMRSPPEQDLQGDALAEVQRRLPRLASYLASLPRGLLSYPECEVRSSAYELFASRAPPPRGEVPPVVGELLGDAGRGWTSEVRMQAALLAIADGANLDEKAFRAWCGDGFAMLYHGVIYRALMALFSPEALMRHAPARYAAFHRGTALEVVRRDARQGEGRLTFPPRIFGELGLVWLSEAFAGAFRCSRALQVTVEVVDASPTHARFVARWG